MESNSSPDMLEDVEMELRNVEASRGQRFANYIVDLIVFYVLLFLVSIFYIAISGNEQIAEDIESLPFFFEQLFGLVLYGLYMSVTEGLFKGKSLGKMITGTRAVSHDGYLITWKEAFSRGLCRMIPFEALSAFGTRPWHDEFTSTRVIRERK